jgi:hypothetical protein
MDIFLGFILWSSRSSTDCIVFRPEAGRPRSSSAIPETIEFYLFPSVQAASGARKTSCSVDTSGSFLGLSGQSVKVTAHVQLVLRFRMGGTVLHSSTCLYGVPKDNFTDSIFTILWASRLCHHTAWWLCTSISWQLVAVFFKVEDGGNKFISNYGQCAQYYMA